MSLDGLYRSAVPELLAFDRHCHLRAVLDARDDLDLVAFSRAQLDLRLLERALLDRVNLVDAVEIAQSVLRDEERLVHVARGDTGPREEAGLQQAALVPEEGLDLEAAGLGLHRGV